MRNITAGALLCLAQAVTAGADAPFVRDGRIGFVVSDIEYALADDAKETGACPAGMARDLGQIYAMRPEGKRRPDETEDAYERRLRKAMRELGTSADGQDLCLNPEAGSPDPHFKTVQGNNLKVEGINLDGSADDNDFLDQSGNAGVDNQFHRLTGCIRSFQSSGQSNDFAIGMLTGAWGILVTLDDVDDLRNDDDVTVGIYANADPIYLSAQREPLGYATYAIHRDPLFRAETKGRLVNGKLTTEPVDVSFESYTNSMLLERPLRDVRLSATLSEDGTLSGYLAGYTPIEDLYDSEFGFRDGTVGDGELASLRLRSGTANGKARVLGYTCQGAYYAMQQLADGHPDSDGNYTSLSTQYRIEAVPAFVVDVETRSANSELAAESEFADEN